MAIVASLLHNVYRAFDFRAEEDICDVLDKSVEGDLLAQIYLETRRGLELANQGGARSKVKEIEVTDLTTRAGQNGGFIAEASWNVAGSVGHWATFTSAATVTRPNSTSAPSTVSGSSPTWKSCRKNAFSPA